MTYKPGAWAAAGVSWPYCPARVISDEEYAHVVSLYGETFARAIYEEVKDGGIPTEESSARAADDVHDAGRSDSAAARRSRRTSNAAGE
jgi:hypothetical protein